jgi:hypothetical protein
MALDSITPPGHLRELSEEGVRAWTQYVADEINTAIRGPRDQANRPDPTDSPRAQFFNPLKTDIGEDAVEKSIFWTAFPKTQRVINPTDRARWEAADRSRDNQDEYCEWGVEKNEGKIVRVTFTSEVPDYWDKLAEDNRERVLDLYRDFLPDERITPEEIFPGGPYARENTWNSLSRTDLPPVHLIETTNNLHAAIELAAAATIPRVIGGVPKVAEQELIECSKYGIGSRHSDPHIGAEINTLARQDADITLADPPGLYISDFSPAGWTTPDGADPKSFWEFTRGEEGRRLRAVYEVKNKDYVVGDIRINGRPIEFGAQIADFVSVKLVGIACRFGKSRGAPFTVCKRD